MKFLSVVTLAAAIGAAIGMAPPAAAGENEYLARLDGRFANVTNAQLLTEGHKVCQMTLSGHPASDAMNIVAKDLAVSVATAVEIITAATTNLGC